MRFELTEALTDDLLFSMEDQEGEFLLDTQEGVVVEKGTVFVEDRDTNRGTGRYIALPAWHSADGYRLMERFAAGYKNTLIRTGLTAALAQGKGVFRAFKDTLNGYPEAEKRWFAFKTREMKLKIIRWYNALRDAWGLERIGTEPEETDDLVLEDFMFRKPHSQDLAAAAELHHRIREEGNQPGAACLPEPQDASGGLALVAETGGGDFAGYIATTCIGKTLYIHALEVKPEYRGLGIGEALFSRVLDTLDHAAISRVSMDLPVEAEWFSRVLLRKSFTPWVTRYGLTLKKSGSYQHEHQEADKRKGYPDSSP
ncbi:MAG: GNAT family N-acetyltransferase [Treponema sp.]|jgi:GNAT superfamily N-acetyltransferase|nr:GNAT family N-acetyltransferase [Treponema sp.]